MHRKCMFTLTLIHNAYPDPIDIYAQTESERGCQLKRSQAASLQQAKKVRDLCSRSIDIVYKQLGMLQHAQLQTLRKDMQS